MARRVDFIDYYDILKVDPGADQRTLEIAYHYFAKLYHPDSPETSDVERFGHVVEAYKVLRDPDRRAAYDKEYAEVMKVSHVKFDLHDDIGIDEDTAVSDAELHARILRLLYKKRRERASDAGVVGWFLQESLGCSEDQFDFHIWYLKSKGLLKSTDQGTLAITIEGVDHVIATARASQDKKLLPMQMRNQAEQE